MIHAQSQTSVKQSFLFPADSYGLNPPVTLQHDCVDKNNDIAMEANPIVMTEVENARVIFDGLKSLVISPTGEHIARVNISDEEISKLSTKTFNRLEGTLLLFGLSSGAHCYYHWMVDLLPKFGILEKAGVSLELIDHVLLRKITSNFQRETLAHLGISENKIVETQENCYLECDRIIHIDLVNGINMKMNRFIPSWLRYLYPPEHHTTKERIKLYISRPNGVRRGIANEEKLIPILKEQGYTICAMEGLSVKEQAKLLSLADVLISPHGGALTNMVFCRPGIKVLELFGRHVYPYYYGLAQMCSHDYFTILENGKDYERLIQHKKARAVGAAKFQKLTRTQSFDVDLNLFRNMLATLDAP